MNDCIQADRVVVRIASANDREHIYRLRHEVYARELGQHPVQESGMLKDPLDASNEYIVATVNDVILGFISVTSPGPNGFSVDKYLRREEFPELQDEKLYEVRLLTVLSPHRGRELALLLMYAAFRWIECQGGQRVVAIGRREVLRLYLRVGLQRLGCRFQSGAVVYELLQASVETLNDGLRKYAALINRLERGVEWNLNCPFRKPSACFHGGAFFHAIGAGFDHLDRRHRIINADVLDAWFPPSPKVMAALQEDLPWLMRTSPPTSCDGLIHAIAEARRVPEDCVVPGAGSSDLIFRAMRDWLTPESRVLILDPTYGEYAHVFEQIIHCRVDRLRLSREHEFQLDLGRLETLLRRNYDLVVIVNPNSPTGQHVPAKELERTLQSVPASTRIWIDETYVEYADADQSLERFASASRNVVVCKSMSKVYALSGARVAYLCGPPAMIEKLRAITPPWVVSLPAQVAAVAALRDPDYYSARYAETHRLRESFACALKSSLGWGVLPGIANFLLCQMNDPGPTAAALVDQCRRSGLFLRDAGPMGRRLGSRALRIAVKDAATNRRMLEILCGLAFVQETSRFQLFGENKVSCLSA